MIKRGPERLGLGELGWLTPEQVRLVEEEAIPLNARTLRTDPAAPLIAAAGAFRQTLRESENDGSTGFNKKDLKNARELAALVTWMIPTKYLAEATGSFFRSLPEGACRQAWLKRWVRRKKLDSEEEAAYGLPVRNDILAGLSIEKFGIGGVTLRDIFAIARSFLEEGAAENRRFGGIIDVQKTHFAPDRLVWRGWAEFMGRSNPRLKRLASLVDNDSDAASFLLRNFVFAALGGNPNIPDSDLERILSSFLTGEPRVDIVPSRHDALRSYWNLAVVRPRDFKDPRTYSVLARKIGRGIVEEYKLLTIGEILGFYGASFRRQEEEPRRIVSIGSARKDYILDFLDKTLPSWVEVDGELSGC
jgi:hypothetical protein